LRFWCGYSGKGLGQCRVRNITIVKLICAFGWLFRPLNTRSVFVYSISRMDIGLARSEWRPASRESRWDNQTTGPSGLDVANPRMNLASPQLSPNLESLSVVSRPRSMVKSMSAYWHKADLSRAWHHVRSPPTSGHAESAYGGQLLTLSGHFACACCSACRGPSWSLFPFTQARKLTPR
jgi:hypothetical protein